MSHRRSGYGQGTGHEQEASPGPSRLRRTGAIPKSGQRARQLAAPRRYPSHSDPFHELEVPSFEAKGPKDPNQGPREGARPTRPEPKPKSKIAGYRIDEVNAVLYHSKWPGVIWYNATIKPGRKREAVVSRRVDHQVATQSFINSIRNERFVMGKLDHKYILICIDWTAYMDRNNEPKATAAIFPKCGKDMKTDVRQVKVVGPVKFPWPGGVGLPAVVPRHKFKVEKVQLFMSQVAQALAYMHAKDYVHTRIHPSSVRRHGNRNIRLSRLMGARKYAPGQPVKGRIPVEAKEYFFISPERFRQEIKDQRIFGKNLHQGIMTDERKKLITDAGEPWDAKKDDIWAFGLVTFFLLTAKYPYKKEHQNERSLLEAMNADFITTRITGWPTLTQDSRDFLLWIVKPNQSERPTMDQILRHPWLQGERKTSPAVEGQVTNDVAGSMKSFRRLPGHIDEDLVRQMAEKGYSVQHKLGAGAFGAVFSGTRLTPEGRTEPIAMKMIKARKGKGTFLSHRWATEHKIMTSQELKHPNLVEVYDVFKEIKRPQHQHSMERRVFVFMELADSDLLEVRGMKGALTEPEMHYMMVQILAGLEFLHEHRIAHRDIKPENVLIFGDNSHFFRLVAKLTDYSLVRQADENTITRSYLGTPPYIAPEMYLIQLIGPVKDVFKMDIWAVGITMFECLTGGLPDWDPAAATQRSIQAHSMDPITEEYLKMFAEVGACGKSAEAISFMQRMLKMNPKNRANLDEVLHHRWMRMQHGYQEAEPAIPEAQAGSPSD